LLIPDILVQHPSLWRVYWSFYTVSLLGFSSPHPLHCWARRTPTHHPFHWWADPPSWPLPTPYC